MKRLLRTLPFFILAIASIAFSARAPFGRHPFHFDFSLSWADVLYRMRKIHHIIATAIFFLLAVFAFDDLLVSFVAAMLVGLGWELGESTVVGHHARLADMAPNLVAALVTWAIVAAVRRSQRRAPATPQA